MEFEMNHKKYKVLRNIRDAFAITDLEEKFTDYFFDFDYILGDYSYGKLRLKGFYDSNNKNCKPYNDFKDVDQYIKTQCAYMCKYFIIQSS